MAQNVQSSANTAPRVPTHLVPLISANACLFAVFVALQRLSCAWAVFCLAPEVFLTCLLNFVQLIVSGPAAAERGGRHSRARSSAATRNPFIAA